jgi:hypothetical protein
MPHSGEARAWWADVEHVREAIERRREAERRATTARGQRHLSVVGDDRHDGERRHGDRRAPARHPGERHLHERHAHERRSGERRAGERREGAGMAATGERRTAATGERRTAATGERRGHGAEARRTVEITGRTVPAPAVPLASHDPTVAFGARGSSRRPSLSPLDRLAHRPDRIALWAVVLGFVLILVAATSA